MRPEAVSPLTHLRRDGRRPNEMRALGSRLGAVPGADGSALVSLGGTVVLAAVFGPHEPAGSSNASSTASLAPHHPHEFHVRGGTGGTGDESSSKTQSKQSNNLLAVQSAAAVTQAQLARLQKRAIITCDYAVAPFAGADRRQPKGQKDRQSQEAALLVRDTFDQAILAHVLPRSQIDIRVQVLQADGSALSTAINAVTLALVHAGIPLEDMVCACSVVAIGNELLLDPNHEEHSSGGAELPVAIMATSGKVVAAQMESKLPIDEFEEALELAVAGCKRVHLVLQEQLETALLSHAQASLAVNERSKNVGAADDLEDED